MIVPIERLHWHLRDKRVAVVFFNKDARSLLRAHAAGLMPVPFTIDYLIDLTLPLRPNVLEMARGLIDPKRIITDEAAVQRLTEAQAFDTVIVFEDGYEDQPWQHLVPLEDDDVASFRDLTHKCAKDLAGFRTLQPKAEFNIRWSKQCVRFVAEYFTQHEVFVLNAYNASVPSVETNDEFLLLFGGRHESLPTLSDALARVPVRFIIGEDWACGKTSYLVNRMREGKSGLAGDFWFHLVAHDAIPPFSMQDMFGIKGVIANLIRRASERNPGQEVFVKYDGRLEEFVFGIPRDRTYLIKDMHAYFADCQFVIVHKGDDSPRMCELVGRFMKKYDVAGDRVRRVAMGYDSSERLLPQL